jgi:hypothetical protein
MPTGNICKIFGEIVQNFQPGSWVFKPIPLLSVNLVVMSRLFYTLFLCIFSFALFPQSRDIEGVKIPDKLSLENEALVLNGAGVREKYFLDLYVCALYLRSKSEDPIKIMNADEKMAIRITIVSSFVSNSAMQKAVREGFEKSTNGNTKPLAREIEMIISAFNDPITKGDMYEITYSPAAGCHLFKNGTKKIQIPGLKFKQALFGIWLGSNPAHTELRNELMGKD